MRVVHVTRTTTADVPGGLEHHVEYLTSALSRRGHDAIVVRTEDLVPSPIYQSRTDGAELMPGRTHLSIAQKLGGCLDTLRTFAHRLDQNRHAEEIARHIKKLRPDIIHQHTYLGGLRLACLLSRSYPLVFTNHTGAYLFFERNSGTRLAQHHFMRVFHAVIGPSRELVPPLHNSYYIPNGVDTDKFKPVPEDVRCQLREKWNCQDRKVFICPRRWAPTKGVIYLAEALGQIDAETLAKSVFLFAGNETPSYGTYQHAVRATLNRCPRGDIRILGNMSHDNLTELLNISDACIIPSLMEATSLSCLESMACGTPVLGTTTGGLLELIEDGRNGWLVPIKDSVALAVQIHRIAGMEAADLAPFREAVLATVQEQYTWKAAACATERVYQAALHHRSATQFRLHR